MTKPNTKSYSIGRLIKKRFLLIVACFLAFPATALCNFDFNANCFKAYQSIFELKLANARQIIAAERKLNPRNAILPLLDNYVDYFYLLTTESKSEFDRLKDNKGIRIDQISDDDRRSPYYLYAQAEINLQWALLRGRYGEYFTAGIEIKRAFGQLTENAKKFPAFHLNLKGLGLVNTVLGSLQDGALKSTLSALGIKGNVQEGISMLDKLAENLPKSAFEPFYEETVFYYAFVLTDVVHSPDAYAKTMKFTARIADESLLKTYLRAYVSSKNAHNDEAITTLANRPAGNGYQSFPYLDYLMGVCKLNKLDYTSADSYFDRFLKNNKGSNYIKDANLHLGWIALAQGNKQDYQDYMAKVKSAGYTFQERDKQAVNEANAPMPDIDLLKARLLFDGGYYLKAQEILDNKKPEQLASEKDRSEYFYRLGRINEAQEKYDAAISNFQEAINAGRTLKYYYAANAALQIGKIYVLKKNYPKAKLFFNTAINMKGHEYENSIESQAKAGLKRTGS